MNTTERKTEELTVDDYLKMCEQCARLEKKNAELSDTIDRMHGGCERAVELQRLLAELFNIGRDEVVSDDEIRRRMKNLRDEVTKLTKENIRLYNQRIQLEDEKKQQADYILELRTELERLHVTAKDSEEIIKNLRECINIANKTAQDYYDEREIFRNVKDEYEYRYNSLVKISDNCAKDADAKIQSANDRAANAKKEAKAAKERAESASERVRYLERKLRDVESLNDSLMKELARRQFNIARDEAISEIREHDADVYQQDVLKYAPMDAVICDQQLTYGVIGLCGEAGEASEIVKKYEFQGHALDSYHLAIELGDVLWYVAYTAHHIGYPLGKIMAMNQEKLAKRYPDGKFDAERSRHREEGDI